MRIAKKLGAVVAMAAVCLTMAAPITAKAVVCPPHEFDEVEQSCNSYTEHHAYHYGTINGDEKIWKDCVITTTKIVYALDCCHCEEYIPNYRETTSVTHSVSHP